MQTVDVLGHALAQHVRPIHQTSAQHLVAGRYADAALLDHPNALLKPIRQNILTRDQAGHRRWKAPRKFFVFTLDDDDHLVDQRDNGLNVWVFRVDRQDPGYFGVRNHVGILLATSSGRPV